MDSCLLGNECINEMGTEANVEGQVREITERFATQSWFVVFVGLTVFLRAMRDGLDFETSLRARVNLVRGLSRSQLENCWSRMKLNPGATRLIRVLRQLG